jgi:hypothetical protein
MNLYKSTGILRYGHEKLIVEVDPGISAFYKSLIPKCYILNPQKYAPHISVVRHEQPNMENWGKYDGQPVEFFYSNIVHRGTVYWWLNAFSNRLEEIRLELGLPVSSPYTRPPDGFEKCFHITLGNSKTTVQLVTDRD